MNDLAPGTDLAVIDASSVEAAADPAQYVVTACERAKVWLAHALEHGGIEEIVELKSQAEAIRIYTMQKQLGKDAELSAAEIVRRAERGIGVAIRRGQAEGNIAKQGENPCTRNQYGERGGSSFSKRLPSEYVPESKERSQAYAMADDVTDEQFESALADGREEGNLSRTNVVRKVQAQRSPDRSPKAAARRRELIREMAPAGWSSKQIGDRIGMLPETVRDIAREEGVAIPADDSLGHGHKNKKIDSNRIVRETVNSLSGLEMGLSLVNYGDLDQSEIENWTSSLAESLRVLNRLNKKLREMVQ